MIFSFILTIITTIFMILGIIGNFIYTLGEPDVYSYTKVYHWNIIAVFCAFAQLINTVLVLGTL